MSAALSNTGLFEGLPADELRALGARATLRTVVARMQQNMQWMNRVVGSQPAPGEPQLRVEEINAFLAKYARR